VPESTRVAAASAAERAELEARFAAACAAANASGAPAPFRGPAADSEIGERFLDIISLVCAYGYALDARPARFICGLTLRGRAVLGACVVTPLGTGELAERRADGVRVVRLPWALLYTRDRVDERGFRGATSDTIECATRLQAPWLEAARAASRDEHRRSNVMRAAAAGDERRVRELLAAGAPWRCVDGKRRTALHWACMHWGPGRVDERSVAALLEVDAVGETVDLQDEGGNTPLVYAAARCNVGAVRALLARATGQGQLQRALCSCGNDADTIELLCTAPGADLAMDAVSDHLGEMLLEASSNGWEDCLRVLLAHGAPQDSRGPYRMAALHKAVHDSDENFVALLCAAPSAAAAFQLHDEFGRTPLGLAVEYGETAIEAVLRAHGALW
jgi:hypothetical protein